MDQFAKETIPISLEEEMRKSYNSNTNNFIH